MARSQAEKEATHRRIVKAAAAQIRRDGVDAVRVFELMREAGLTHGGFYRHFDSREDLIDEAIDAALTDGSRQTDTGESLDPGAELAQIIDGYVSKAHRDNPQVGCAVAALWLFALPSLGPAGAGLVAAGALIELFKAH